MSPQRRRKVAEPKPGDLVGSYLVEDVLGRGGMGMVYRAEDQRPGTLGRKVALKVLVPSLSEDDRFRQRFERESQMAASLDHPNIVPVFEAGNADGLLYIAMRYVEGQDLHTLLRSGGPLSPARSLSIIAQVASALDAAHARGLVHRDVKPGNILVSGDDPDAPHVYLTDFGITKHTKSRSGLTKTGQFVGTVEYVAPEQIESKAVDGRADIYSLTCVLVECLTGEPPFGTEQDATTLYAHLSAPPPRVSQRRPDLPPALDEAVARGLAKSPEDRFATCRELVETVRDGLRAASAGATRAAPIPAPVTPSAPPLPHPSTLPQVAPPPLSPPASSFPPPRRGIRPLTLGLILGGIAVLVAAVVVVVLVAGGGDDPPPPPTNPFPNQAERDLLAIIPASLQTPPCTRGQLPPGASAAVDCPTDTPQFLAFLSFPDAASMNALYQQEVTGAGVAADTGDCSAGEPSEGSWTDPNGTVSGRLLCFVDPSGVPVVIWTHDELLTAAAASGSAGGDLAAVYQFWSGIADYAAV